jgi:serine/alanine adding enzyme
VEFEIVEGPHEQSWREALRLRADALVFQSPEMLDVFGRTEGLRPGVLVAVEKQSGRGLACLAWIAVVPSGPVGRALLSRCICQGGPVYQPGSKAGLQAARALVERHAELVRADCVYSEFRNGYDRTGIPEALEGLAEPEPHCNFLIDVSRGPEAVWRQMSSGRRKGIRRAERQGITVRRVALPREVEECHRLFQLTYRRARLPLFDVSLFRAAASVLVDRVRFYVAARAGQALAARALLLTEHTMYDWFAGSTEAGERARANELIVWEALQEACRLGLQRFDFGGGGHPDRPYGPREFKRRFGGSRIEYQRFVIRHAPVRSALISAARKLRR